MTWVFMHSPATGNDRLVLLAIADEADDEGLNARPGVRRIAAKSRAHVSTASRCTARLEAGGELLVLRPETRGRGRYNRYAVVMGRDPLALAEALGWPPPVLTGPPEEWAIDDIESPSDEPDTTERMVANCALFPDPQPEGETPVMVADCDLFSTQERSTSRGNGGTSAAQNTEKRAGMVAPDARRSFDSGSIDPRGAAPVSKTNPRPGAAPADSVPPELSTGLGRRPARPADPLDGIAAATAALAERARAREAELADKPRTPPPPAWKDQLLRRLHGTAADTEAVRP